MASNHPDYAHLYNTGISPQDLQLIARQRAAHRQLRRPMPHSSPRRESPIARSSSQTTLVDEKSSPPTISTSGRRRTSSSLGSEGEDWLDEDDGILGGYMEKEYDLPYLAQSRYYPSKPRRPLIDRVRNEWRTNPKFGQVSGPPSPDPYGPPDCRQVLTAPRLRRFAVIILMLWGLCWVGYNYWLIPKWEEDLVLAVALDGERQKAEGWFGVNARPVFTDLIQLRTLDPTLVPGRKEKGRLIIIGDVHGCKKELKALLAKVSYQPPLDHLILTGDLITKGPDSAGVVDLVRSMGASCVRGNHEDRVLLTYRDIHSQRASGASKIEKHPNSPYLTDDEDAAPPVTNLELAQNLTRAQADYLSACPVILKVGEVRGMGEVIVVHAGLVPGVDLERQDALAVMSMRTLDLETQVPSRSPDGTPWSQLWEKYQARLPKRLRSTVVYGHNSHRGLSLDRYSKGLDSGCVSGGRLTALTIQDAGRWYGSAKLKVFSVECGDYRPKGLDLDFMSGSKGIAELGQS